MITPAQVEFGVIPHDHWFQPDWIDEEKAKKGRDKLVADGIIYGGSVSYRNMCRFNSGVSQFYLLWCVECSLIPSSSFSVILWCRNIDGIGVSSRHRLNYNSVLLSNLR